MTWAERFSFAGIILTAAGLIWQQGRTKKTDAVAEKTGAATAKRAGQLQRWEELESLNERLREDNQALREDKRELIARMDRMDDEIDILKQELARMKRKFGENGPIEGATT